MISILSHMDEKDIAQEIRMERMVHKGSFLILEGKTDVKRFKKFISDSCSIVCCQSVRKAEGVMRIASTRGWRGILAILDQDFRILLGANETNGNITRSNAHDLDIDWFNSNALDKYLAEVADTIKLESFENTDTLRLHLHELIWPISNTKYLVAKRILRIKTSEIDVVDIIDKNNDIADMYVEKLISYGRISADQKSTVLQAIRTEGQVTKDKPFDQMSNGHDLCAALGALLKSTLGKRRNNQVWASEIEAGIRMCFDIEDLVTTSVYRQVRQWEIENPGFNIFRAFAA